MLRALCASTGPRFAVVGLAMTVLHLSVFRLMASRSVAEVANVVAFLVVTQINFSLSHYWTWSSRRVAAEETVRAVLRRALVFNGSAALAFSVNAAVFSLAYRGVGTSSMVSALVATVASAAASFLLSSRVAFRLRPLPDAEPVAVLPPALTTATSHRVTAPVEHALPG
jgi:putative flippase GtrA